MKVDFLTLVNMYSAQALIALGKLPDPEGNNIIATDQAQMFIYILKVLKEKTKGNLNEEELKLINTALSEIDQHYKDVVGKEAGA